MLFRSLSREHPLRGAIIANTLNASLRSAADQLGHNDRAAKRMLAAERNKLDAYVQGGQITIAATSCRKLMPDPAFYAKCLQDSFDEMKAATLGESNARKPAGSGASPSEAAL